MDREMPSRVDVTGEWFLPGASDHVATGTLSWNSTSGGELVIVGSLSPSTPAVDPMKWQASDDELRIEQVAEIFGRVGGREVTLMNATQVGRTVSRPSGQLSERYQVMTFLEGSHLSNASSTSFVDLSISLKHLATWIGRTALAYSHSERGADGDSWQAITASDLPAIEFSTPTGQASFWHVVEVPMRRYQAEGFEEDWRLAVRGNAPTPLDGLLDVASDLQDLVSLASNDCAEFGPAHLTHPEVRIRSMAGEDSEYLSTVQYFAPWSNKSKAERRMHQSELLFTFDDIGGESGLRDWCGTAARYRSQLGKLLGTRYNEHMYLEDRLLNACVALESFDKARRPETADDRRVSYVSRVKACVELVGASCLKFLPDDTDEWGRVVKDRRHELAHRGRASRPDDDRGHWTLWQQVFWLVALCLLKEAGVTDVVLDKVAARSSVW